MVAEIGRERTAKLTRMLVTIKASNVLESCLEHGSVPSKFRRCSIISRYALNLCLKVCVCPCYSLPTDHPHYAHQWRPPHPHPQTHPQHINGTHLNDCDSSRRVFLIGARTNRRQRSQRLKFRARRQTEPISVCARIGSLRSMVMRTDLIQIVNAMNRSRRQCGLRSRRRYVQTLL